MVRGDPVCRKEDCSQYDIGVVFTEISSYSDQDKFKFIENVWKPGELFDFPASVECSNSNRHFVWSWLKRFPWLAYSKYLDGAFCLPCVLFGVQCGRNTNKLDKLYKSPLTLICILRNTMVQDRLNGLALMHAHRGMELDLEQIIDLFANLHPRRMRMENILNE